MPVKRRELWSLLGGVFLVSFSLIAFEITLSRLLSVLLSYHYVFVVLSLALMGLGLGGMFVHFLMPRVPVDDKRRPALALFTSLFSLTMVLCTWIAVRIGYMEDVQLNILLHGLLLLIPFSLAGVLMAEVYRAFSAMSGRIYGADLIGAAAGAFGAIVLLNVLGGITAHLSLGFVASLAAVLFALGGLPKGAKGLIISSLSSLALCALLGMNLVGAHLWDIPIGANPSKEIHDALSSFQGKIIETRWSAFGRTDLVEFDEYPDHKDIYIDGTAGSPMYRFSGNIRDPGAAVSDLKVTFPGYFPLHDLKEEERDSALIIGPGGGRDVLLLLMAGVQAVTAVEVNGDLVQMVREYARFNGGLYTGLRNVKIIVEEGRHFLKRQKGRYDVIMLSLPVTNTSRSLEGYALTENFLFTVESVGDYLDHLTDEGRLVVVGHNDAEALRLLCLSLAALHRRGLSVAKAMRRIYIVGSDEYLVLVLKKTPLEPAEALHLYGNMQQFGLQSMLSYFPFMRQPGAVNPALMALGSGRMPLDQFVNMVKERDYDISPVTDDSPFFYRFELGTPKPVSVVFWSSMVLFPLVLMVPVWFRKRGPRRTGPSLKDERPLMGSLKCAVLFAMLGMGFMLAELSLIQRFMLFLGHPVLSLALLLSFLLGGAGMGGLWSGRLAPERIDRGIAASSLCIVLAVVGYTLVLPMILGHLLGLDLSTRMLVSGLIVIPLGFLMGIPFPLGIRRLRETGVENHIPWMWGINGVSSVMGSALTILVAVSFGFTQALLVSGACYFIAFLAFLRS